MCLEITIGVNAEIDPMYTSKFGLLVGRRQYQLSGQHVSWQGRPFGKKIEKSLTKTSYNETTTTTTTCREDRRPYQGDRFHGMEGHLGNIQGKGTCRENRVPLNI